MAALDAVRIVEEILRKRERSRNTIDAQMIATTRRAIKPSTGAIATTTAAGDIIMIAD